MAISHWKNRSKQDKFTTIKGLLFGWTTLWIMYHCFQKIHVNCYLAETQFQPHLHRRVIFRKSIFFIWSKMFHLSHVDIGT